MNDRTIYKNFLDTRINNKKKLAVLIDPDKVGKKDLEQLKIYAINANVDYFFVGGSLVLNSNFDAWIDLLKKNCSIPVILFPGSQYQLSEKADAVLLLSLISSRNPDLLIGQHVIAAPMLYRMDLDILSTGYMLIDGGKPTTVSYISNSTPIPADKPQIAVCTALAGVMLGMKVIYMDAGSGAKNAISSQMIREVRKHINVPLIIGGGIRNPEMAIKSCEAGADIIVIGTALEKDPSIMEEMAAAIHGVEMKIQ